MPCFLLGIDFNACDFDVAVLEDHPDRAGDNTFANATDDTAGDQDVLHVESVMRFFSRGEFRRNCAARSSLGVKGKAAILRQVNVQLDQPTDYQIRSRRARAPALNSLLELKLVSTCAAQHFSALFYHATRRWFRFRRTDVWHCQLSWTGSLDCLERWQWLNRREIRNFKNARLALFCLHELSQLSYFLITQ